MTTRPSGCDPVRDVCHATLGTTLLYLLWHLARLPAAGPTPSALAPAVVASWAVLGQTSLLALVLFRLGDALLGSRRGHRATASGINGQHDEVGVRDLERFAGACAAGVWGTRHFILLLQTTSPQALEPPSRHELAVVRSTGLVTLVLVILTLANIVWGEVEVDDTDAMPADVAESTEKGSVTLPDSRPVRPIMAEEVLEQASPVFRRAVLAGCGLTTVLVATVTLSDGHRLATPLLVPVAFSLPFVLFSRWLSTAGLSLGLLAGTLIWFHLAIAYLEVSSFGPAGHPPWRSLAWLSLLVSLGHSVWLASLYVSIGARAPSDEGPDASIVHRLRLSVRRIHDVTLDRLLRAAPVIQIHDGLTESPPDSPV